MRVVRDAVCRPKSFVKMHFKCVGQFNLMSWAEIKKWFDFWLHRRTGSSTELVKYTMLCMLQNGVDQEVSSLRDVFDLISHRYKSNQWRLLNLAQFIQGLTCLQCLFNHRFLRSHTFNWPSFHKQRGGRS